MIRITIEKDIADFEPTLFIAQLLLEINKLKRPYAWYIEDQYEEGTIVDLQCPPNNSIIIQSKIKK